MKQQPQLEMGEIEEHVNKTVPCLKEVPGPVNEGCTEEKQVQVFLEDCEIRKLYLTDFPGPCAYFCRFICTITKTLNKYKSRPDLCGFVPSLKAKPRKPWTISSFTRTKLELCDVKGGPRGSARHLNWVSQSFEVSFSLPLPHFWLVCQNYQSLWDTIYLTVVVATNFLLYNLSPLFLCKSLKWSLFQTINLWQKTAEIRFHWQIEQRKRKGVKIAMTRLPW